MSINWLKITDSTNNEAIKNRDNESDMTVWCTDFQTSGRGQKGNKWESSPGKNLTFSILFKPKNIDANASFLISQIIALGIVDYLEEHGISAKVKWPNDIYVEERKICGMLIENFMNNDKLAVSVSGIGININQRLFSPELPNPTSLILELEKIGKGSEVRMDLKNELSKVLKKIFFLYINIDRQGKRSELYKRYDSMLYRLGEYHYYDETEYCVNDRIGRIYGKIVGIDSKTARLKIELKNGLLREYCFNELKYIV